jgi:taurine dioxygenase
MFSSVARRFSSSSAAVTVTPLSPAIGAVVDGVDLAASGAAHGVALRAALVKHHVLFFRGQAHVKVTQLRDFAALFGALHRHPLYPNAPEAPEIIVLDTDESNPPDNDNWHTDVTFIQTPPLGAVLQAIRIPETGGGDTCWASTAAAYDALSPPLRKFLVGLTATHDIQKSFPATRWASGDEEAKYRAAVAKHPPIVHPVVREHPETGRLGLFVNSGFTTHINELSRTESDALLALLFAHVSKPEFTVRWRWSAGDVAFWDNRLTQHYALNDYLPHRRTMHRATILGDRPRGPTLRS